LKPMLAQKKLGYSGLEVSEFCLGILPMGPLQADLPEKYCIGLIEEALELGVTFYDTAESYRTQSYLGSALDANPNKKESVVIATKSVAENHADMERSVNQSLEELKRDYIDIYHLHAARPPGDLFEQRRGALQCLQEMKQKGVIRAIGVSTHKPQIVSQAAERNDIDVVYPLINSRGMGIVEGAVDDMLKAIGKAHRAGKGIYAMKVLAGGNLIHQLEEAVNWVRNIEGMDAVSMGVVSEAELLYNLSVFNQEEQAEKPPAPAARTKKLFIFHKVCIGCGNCVEMCPNGALSLVEEKARVEHEQCILCGYCSPVCPKFAIRLV